MEINDWVSVPRSGELVQGTIVGIGARDDGSSFVTVVLNNGDVVEAPYADVQPAVRQHNQMGKS